jgi:ATP-binding cassette subfamily B multidrug efflux pump
VSPAAPLAAPRPAPEAPPAGSVLLRLARYVVRHRGLVLGSIGVMLAVAALDLLLPDLARRAIDGPVRTGDAGGLLRYGLLLAGAAVAGSAMRYAQQVVTVLTGQRIGRSLRLDAFAHLQRMGLAYFDRNPVGVLVTRVTSDVEAVEEFFASSVAAVFYDLLKLAAIVVWLLWIDVRLALTILLVLPAILVVTAVFTRRSRRDFRRVRAEVAASNAYAQEAISGMRVTRLFFRSDRARGGFEGHAQRLYEAHDATVFNFAFFFPAVEFLQAVATAAAIAVGARALLDGSLTYGAFVQFFLLVNMFFEPLRDLSQNFNTFLQAMVSAERVFRVMDTPEQVPGRPGAVDASGISGAVGFEDVRFAYDPSEPVLRGVSFQVPAGKTLAVVGATGAGKSSVMALVPRFYDVTGGRVTVDGRDVRDYEPRSLRARIAVVPQDVFLFTGSVLENVRLFDPAISREDVERAMALVRADALLARLPRGLDEEVRERGSNLSLGERQLIAFARALVRDPAILVLDEATSSVDTETEVRLQEALRTLRSGRTTLVVAHRLSTVRDADEILVLHHGEVRERGTHADLLRQDGLYRRLYELQVRETGAG